MLFTVNPAKNWVWTDFVKLDKEGTLPPHKAFVKSLATDNPFVGQDYIDNLKRSDFVTVQRLLYGNFEYDDDPRSLIPYDAIADIWTNPQINGDKYITADIARLGSDKTIIMVWDGFAVIHIDAIQRQTTDIVAKHIIALSERYLVGRSRIIVDEDGVGGGVKDQIPGCIGFVNNSSPIEAKGVKPNYTNLKSQCYFALADRIKARGVSIRSDNPEIRNCVSEELEQVKQKDIDKDGKLAVIPKEQVKEFIGRSPDYSDALMMREWFELKPQGFVTSNAAPIKPYTTAIRKKLGR
jgi:hypothetical protein